MFFCDSRFEFLQRPHVRFRPRHGLIVDREFHACGTAAFDIIGQDYRVIFHIRFSTTSRTLTTIIAIGITTTTIRTFLVSV